MDLSAQLAPGETPTLPLVTLYDLTGGGTVGALPSAQVVNIGQSNGSPQWTWQFPLAGSKLSGGHTYRLVGTYTASAGKLPAFEVIILCLDPARTI